MGELSRNDASFVEDLLSWSKKLILIEPHLEESLFKELCGDSVMVGAALNL